MLVVPTAKSATKVYPELYIGVALEHDGVNQAFLMSITRSPEENFPEQLPYPMPYVVIKAKNPHAMKDELVGWMTQQEIPKEDQGDALKLIGDSIRQVYTSFAMPE